MANTPAVQLAVSVASGTPKVFPLLGGTSLGAQDGSDLGTGGPVVANAETNTNSLLTNRGIEFLNDRYALTASGTGALNQSGVYKKNQGGAGQWGLVSMVGDQTLSTGIASGLFVLHPDGKPTLCYLANCTGNRLHAYRTTDGTTGADWVSVGLFVDTSFAATSGGQAIAFKDSIIWAHGNVAAVAGAGMLSQYDYKTGLLTRYNPSSILGITSGVSFGLHVHEGVVYLAGLRVGGTPNLPVLTKLTGGSFSVVHTVTGHKTNSGSAHPALFTDTVTGDLIWVIGGRSDPGNVEGAHVARIQDPFGAATYSDISAVVFGTVEGADKYLPGGGDTGGEGRRFSISVDTITDPTAPRTYITTWLTGGTTETWEWKGFGDGVTPDDSEVELVGGGAGVSDSVALPYNTRGDGGRSPSIARISIGDVVNPPVEVAGGTKMFFRGMGSAPAGNITFRGTDNQGAPDTVVPISAGSLVVGKALLENSLECYYKFNDDGLDASGNDRTLTFNGAEAYATGRFGNGYDLPGSEVNFAVRGVSDAALNLTGNYTISFWINPTVIVGVDRTVVEKYQNPGGWSCSILANGGIIFIHNGTITSLTAPAASITTGSLQHVFVVADGDTIKIYVNNVEVASNAYVANQAHGVPLKVGDSGVSNTPFDGVIDEVAIWTRTITPTERGYVYNAGAGFELEGLTPWAAGQPSVGGNTIINLTPDEGSTLYSIVLDTGAAGVNIDEGDTGLLIAELL